MNGHLERGYMRRIYELIYFELEDFVSNGCQCKGLTSGNDGEIPQIVHETKGSPTEDSLDLVCKESHGEQDITSANSKGVGRKFIDIFDVSERVYLASYTLELFFELIGGNK